MLLINNLPSGYHRDLQLVKASIIPAIQELKACLDITIHSLKNVKVNQEILNDDKYDYLFSVETLNELVINGMSFRDAYKKIGNDIAEGKYKPNKTVQHTHEGSIGNLCLKEIRQKWN